MMFSIFILVLLFLLLRNVSIIRKSFVFFLLFILWAFGFIYSPYWHALVTHIYLKYIVLYLLFTIGLLWSYGASTAVKIPKISIKILPVFILFLALYLTNYTFLKADIPYRGDEDFHIYNILELGNYFTVFWQNRQEYLYQSPLFWIFCFLVLFLIAGLFFQKKLKKKFTFILFSIALFLIPLSASIIFPENIFRDNKNTDIYNVLGAVLRYPFFQKWINLLFVLPNFYNDIQNFRTIPFLSAFFLSAFLFHEFNKSLKNPFLSILFSFAFLTIPLILFYSNILYLEMPLILLMTICVFNLPTLIKLDTVKLKSNPVWFCLLLFGFLKETAIIFTFLILLLRFVYQNKKGKKMNIVFQEIVLSILVLLPFLIFLSFRRGITPYVFYFKNAFEVSNYLMLGKSLIEQSGILIIIAVAGIILLILRKNVLMLISVSTLFLGTLIYFLVYVMKVHVVTHYASWLVGYSRYNLYLLPMILYLGYIFIVFQKRYVQILIILALFVGNYFLIPFKADGTRLPNWGSPNTDTAEYAYPYNESIEFLSKQDVQNLIILGQYSHYFGLKYYFDKYNFHPQTIEYPFGQERFDRISEQHMFNEFFDNQPPTSDTILYHSVNNINLDRNILYGKKYKIVKRIQNSMHSIYILKEI